VIPVASSKLFCISCMLLAAMCATPTPFRSLWTAEKKEEETRTDEDRRTGGRTEQGTERGQGRTALRQHHIRHISDREPEILSA
jgi:hypothetical protein